MRKILTFLIILAIIVKATLTFAMPPIPNEAKKNVTFILFPNEKGELTPIGTAFFVGVKYRDPPKPYRLYLVTAKHVLKNPKTDQLLPFIVIRVQDADGQLKKIILLLTWKGKDKNVFVHDKDSTADLVVITQVPHTDKYNYNYIPDDMITTKKDFKELNIREGAEVFFTGMFTPYLGEKNNYPIARFGRVALVTNEKIIWDGVKTDLYLIECASYGGNSGSPVYFYLGAERDLGKVVLGGPIWKLAGILKGSFGRARPIEFIETTKVPMAISNIGISAVVPAYKLYEILFGEELKNIRKLLLHEK